MFVCDCFIQIGKCLKKKGEEANQHNTTDYNLPHTHTSAYQQKRKPNSEFRPFFILINNADVGQPRSLLTCIKGRKCDGVDPHLSVLLTQQFALFLTLIFLDATISCGSWKTGWNKSSVLLFFFWRGFIFCFKLDEACGKFWSAPRWTTTPALILGAILVF